MELGRVIAPIWATQQAEALEPYKLLQIRIENNYKSQTIVAIDNIGAGIGELVIVVAGSSARAGQERAFLPIDATVVGIVDKSKDFLLNKKG